MDVKKRDQLLQILSELVSPLSEKEKRDLLEQLLGKKEGFPISIFKSRLSGLEAIVVYLKDVKGQSINEIAQLLNRKKSTIYTTYRKAKLKVKHPLDASDFSVVIPYHIFAERKFAVLENIVAHLKDEQNLSFKKISVLLNKKYSTVRTVYVRYQKKCS